MLEFKDICLAYLEGYIYAKVTENMIRGKVRDSDVDTLKEIAVKCMVNYISQLEISEADKEELKQNQKQWAEMVIKGVKQRLRECDKIES